MPKKQSQSSEEFDRFKALTGAVAAVPKAEIDKRAAVHKRKRKRAKQKLK